MTKIRAVVFDHGGVLTPGGGPGTNEQAAAEAMGLPGPVQVPELSRALKIGEITSDDWVNEINARFPDAPRPLTHAVWQTIFDRLAPDLEAYAFAERCRQAGLKVALLSSVPRGVALRLYAVGAYDGFDPQVLSCHEGTAKPATAAYAAVENYLPRIKPEEFLFLDDQEKCCEGARRRGWQAIRITSTEQMIRDAGALLGLR